MREIKFRAWDKHTKEMMYNVGYDKEAEGGVRPWIFMQFTGLKDKNGVEIYEDDIVRHPKFYERGVEFSVVKWDSYANGWGGPLGLMHGGEVWESEDLEVVGNIYENPELVK